MRLAGRISEWNDDKGFGFVVPNGGGTRAFVHVRQFQRGSWRPVTGDLISYVAVLDERGRTNAQQVRHAGQKIEAPPTPSRMPRAVFGAAALALGGISAAIGVLPPLLLAATLGLSVVSFLMYWWDKGAAQGGRPRTPENTLHLFDLLGGWPGALIAQQQFRHKTAKTTFQAKFWVCVVLNLAICVWLVRSGVAAELVRPFST